MDQNEDPRELELKIEQAERIAARIGDPTTYERLKSWADELRGRLRRRLDARRTKQAISTRARETSHIDLDQLSAPGMHKEITFIPCSSRQAFHRAKAKRRNAL